MERFQSSTLHPLGLPPWFIRNDVIQWGLWIPPLETFIQSMSVSLFSKAKDSTCLHLYNLDSTDTGLPSISFKHSWALLDNPTFLGNHPVPQSLASPSFTVSSSSQRQHFTHYYSLVSHVKPPPLWLIIPYLYCQNTFYVLVA